jgi:hypothetical protein
MQSLEKLQEQRKELNEHRDCAIVSFAQASGNDYKSVAKLSYKLGRKKGHRTCWYVVGKLARKFKMKYVPYKRMQSKNFLKDAEFLKDPIVVSVSGHMFVAKQGKPIWGLWKEKAIVQGYYIKK